MELNDTIQNYNETNIKVNQAGSYNPPNSMAKIKFQEQYNKLRERLFRHLSKVPIQVESLNYNYQYHPSLITSSIESDVSLCNHQQQSTSQFDEWRPLLIKYYQERAAGEILNLHYGCSFLSHDHKFGLTPDFDYSGLLHLDEYRTDCQSASNVRSQSRPTTDQAANQNLATCSSNQYDCHPHNYNQSFTAQNPNEQDLSHQSYDHTNSWISQHQQHNQHHQQHESPTNYDPNNIIQHQQQYQACILQQLPSSSSIESSSLSTSSLDGKLQLNRYICRISINAISHNTMHAHRVENFFEVNSFG